MTQHGSQSKRDRLRGVTELPESHGERRFRARIRRGRGREVNLGVYPTRWLAAFAYNVAAGALHGDRRPPNAIPEAHQPDADRVRWVTARVHQRLGLDEPEPGAEEHPPEAEELLTLLEITVVGFWRDQVAAEDADLRQGLDAAARRLVEAARILFWSRSAGHPTPLEALVDVLGRRLDGAFRRSDLTREVLDDDGDDPARVARWLVYPDALPGGRGFRDAVAQVYAEVLGIEAAVASASPSWAAILGVAPPYTTEEVRAAYRARSKALHPDVGGSHAEFVRLQAAYEEAQRYCRSRGF